MMKLSDEYLVGFTEGEGMFYIGIVPSPETTSGWQVIYFLKISQNPQGRVVLNQFKKRLNCGYIKSNSQSDPTDKSLAFVVRNFKDLKTKVVPFYEGNLIIKRKNFEKFKKVLAIVDQGKHLTREGIDDILKIAYSMNTKKRKVSKSEILKSYKNL